jgi:serine/threonine protein kinase
MEHNNSFIICTLCSCSNPAKAKFCLDCGALLAGDTKSKSGGMNDEAFNHSEAFRTKYEILEKIGEGGMSVVYKAVQKNIQKTIAIKILKKTLLHDEDSIKRFHEEARNAGALKHPNIISIFDEGEIDNIHYIAMEYLYGVDFQDYVHQNGTLDESRFKEIFIQLADALQYLENHKLTHRDVKSSNIFITKEGKPILMDFGIASQGVLTSSSLYETNYGTPEYMSPEQINGIAIDSRSDLFSLGVVMYEALTGKLPFKGAVYSDTLNLILHAEPDMGLIRSSGQSPKLESLIQKLLKKDPTERFQHASEVAVYLSKKYSKEGITLPAEKLLKPAIYFLTGLIVVTGMIVFKPWDYFNVSPPKEKTGTKAPQNTPSVNTEIRTEKSPLKVNDDIIDEVNPPIVKPDISFEKVPNIIEIPSVRKNPPTTSKKRSSSGLSNRAEKASEFVDEAKNALYQENDASKALRSAEEALKNDPESQIAKDLKEAAEEKLKKQEGDIK